MRTRLAALVAVLALTGCGTPAPGLNPVQAALPSRVWGDGIYLVGVEIPPGVYTTTSGPGEYRCHWARLRSFGQPDSIIAESNLDPGETQTVMVLATDRGFKVSNGCYWRRG